MVDKSIPWTSQKTNRKGDKSLLTPPLLSKLLKRKLSFKDDLNFKGLLVCSPLGYSTKGGGERRTWKNLNKGSCLSQIVIEIALCLWALIGINLHMGFFSLLNYHPVCNTDYAQILSRSVRVALFNIMKDSYTLSLGLPLSEWCNCL